MAQTKEQMIERIAELELQLERQKHLADAVAAKDQEIGKLSETMSQKWQKQLDEKENVIKMLVTYIQSYQQAFRSFLKNTQGGLENAVELEALLSEKLNKK